MGRLYNAYRDHPHLDESDDPDAWHQTLEYFFDRGNPANGGGRDSLETPDAWFSLGCSGCVFRIWLEVQWIDDVECAGERQMARFEAVTIRMAE